MRTDVSDRLSDRDSRARANSGARKMSALAAEYPELSSFTADATLSEIKTRYGLGSFEQVRELGRRRQQRH